MEDKTPRKYNSEFRNSIKVKISKLINKSDYISIYKIINNELGSRLTINRNGIYFNLNLLSNNAIEEIVAVLSDKIDTETSEQPKMKYHSYNKENLIENFIQGQKLTNQEKSLIKKFHQK